MSAGQPHGAVLSTDGSGNPRDTVVAFGAGERSASAGAEGVTIRGVGAGAAGGGRSQRPFSQWHGGFGGGSPGLADAESDAPAMCR